MPKLWNDTIEEHRRLVRDATLDAAATLVAEQGLLSVTMSGIAERTGIGRATLYKYFPDVEAVLLAWHERQVGIHLEELARIGSQAGDGGQRLHAVLHAYAHITHDSRRHHHDSDLGSVLHRGGHVASGEQQLRDLLGGLLAAAASTGEVRDDVPPAELAAYCLHALVAARSLPSKAAVHRLVALTLAGLRPDRAR